MKFFSVPAALMVAGVLVAAPAFAQQGGGKQKTDGDGLPMVGPGSKAYKQQTDGEGLPMVGPGSKAVQAADAEPEPRQPCVGHCQAELRKTKRCAPRIGDDPGLVWWFRSPPYCGSAGYGLRNRSGHQQVSDSSVVYGSQVATVAASEYGGLRNHQTSRRSAVGRWRHVPPSRQQRWRNATALLANRQGSFPERRDR